MARELRVEARLFSGIHHAAITEMGLIDLAVIGILQGLLAWRYITLMNRQLSRSLLAGENR